MLLITLANLSTVVPSSAVCYNNIPSLVQLHFFECRILQFLYSCLFECIHTSFYSSHLGENGLHKALT